METTKIMTSRRDGQPGNEYRDFGVVSLNTDDARLYLHIPEDMRPAIPAGCSARLLAWRDHDGALHHDLITWQRPGTDGAAAARFLAAHDILVRGWNAG